jgi:hypothetical protein
MERSSRINPLKVADRALAFWLLYFFAILFVILFAIIFAIMMCLFHPLQDLCKVHLGYQR